MPGVARVLVLEAALVAGCGGLGVRGQVDGAAGQREAAAAVDGEGGAARPACEPASGCTFCVTAELSPRIATVGIVTWTTDLPDLVEAHIDFGPTAAYGMTAPVDQAEPDHRTLLLGMRQRTEYHFRVVASSGTATCASLDRTIATGSLMNGLPTIRVVDHSSAAPRFGGFLVAGQYLRLANMSKIPAYVIDADGKVVWAYGSDRDVTGAVLSYDGKAVWLDSANFPDSQASVHRVSMDGLVDEDLSSYFVGQNHQLTVLPDETVAFYAYGAGDCDDIKEFSPATKTVRVVANAGVAQGGVSPCHLNDLQYSAEDDTLVFSDFVNQAVVKVRRSDGATVWVVNGDHPTLAGTLWRGNQHGIHLLGLDRFMLFNNNSQGSLIYHPEWEGSGDGSIVFEVVLDLAAGTAKTVWSYKAAPGVQNDLLGDLQRLPNGNTVIGYGTKGTLHEVSPDGILLREWNWPFGATFGYIQKRATLYGPPPR
jgi:hypothetical protein